MSEDGQRVCATCRFFDEGETVTDHEGCCRYFPPSWRSMPELRMGEPLPRNLAYPPVMKDWWCGKYAEEPMMSERYYGLPVKEATQ